LDFNSLVQNELNIPEKPGVYRFFDSSGQLIYVGKAKNLKKRVSSYFSKTHQDRKTTRLVSLIRKIEFTITNTEFDALLLENNLIKEHQPRYNINLRDDKTYPYLVITKEPFPRIFPTRRKLSGRGEYFGPFPSGKMMHALLELFKKVFTFRSCKLQLTDSNIRKGSFKVCLEYHIGNCLGPCTGLQKEASYLEEMEQARQMLLGKTAPARQYFREQMSRFSANLEFEKAQKAKEKLQLLERWQSNSVVAGQELGNLDVLALLRQDDDVFISYLGLSEGRIIRAHTFEFRCRMEEEDSDLLAHALLQLGEIYGTLSGELITNTITDIVFPDWKISVPQRGEKKKLLDMALKNALFARKEKVLRDLNAKAESPAERILSRMKMDLRLDRLPKRIECFDNSNLQGTNPVSAMVCFIDAKPAKKEYRHFNVKTVEGPDDFASMKEVVGRRYKRQLEEAAELPDLILIDGGKGQLSAACDSLKELGLYGKIPIIGIAKRLEELYYPNDPIPLHLDKKSETLKVLQRARDEAHRFGITFHRSKRNKAGLKTALESVSGLGAKTVEYIYRNFKSVSAINEADREKIEAGIGKKRSDVLFAFLNNSEPKDNP
jgi:excinuclease ABC subunit C